MNSAQRTFAADQGVDPSLWRRVHIITPLLEVWQIIVALIASYLFISVVYSSFKILELRKQESEIQGDIAAQEQIAKDLKSEIEYLKTDAAVEKLAREELGLVRPDEILILPKKS